MLTTEFHRILQLGSRNLLLFGIFIAIALGIRLPTPVYVLDTYNFTAPLVALIFIAQGLNMNFSHASKMKEYVAMLVAGAIIAIVAYPALAYLFSKFFSLSGDFALGFILICCFPNSLEAAMAMTMSASGDRITSVILVTGLSLMGIVSIPANIFIWLGDSQTISPYLVLTKITLYVFLPIIAGQVLRYLFPKLPKQTQTLSHYLPIRCLSLLVYFSCSREAVVIHELNLGLVAHSVLPSASLHFLTLIAALLVGKYLLRLSKAANRSFTFICSEKPMSLTVALWSVTYASDHPASIFPILVFYISQMIIDSFIISRLSLKDYSNLETRKAQPVEGRA